MSTFGGAAVKEFRAAAKRYFAVATIPPAAGRRKRLRACHLGLDAESKWLSFTTTFTTESLKMVRDLIGQREIF